MYRFLLRLVINGFALFVAISLVGGLSLHNPDPTSYIILALIFGLVNALVKPVLKLLSCAVIFLTLGLFTLIINTGLFYLTSWIGGQFGFGILIESFWAAFFGALIVSIVSVFFNIVLRDELKGGHQKRKQK
jgi:putative membrane protein